MYNFPKKEVWTGRIDSTSEKSSFRYHQMIQMWDMSEEESQVQAGKKAVLIGFECEEGVRRNKGRTGAAKAPAAIRQALAKLSWHGGSDQTIVDGGTVVCEGSQLEKAQKELGHYITKVLEEQSTPVILGGGHETLYGHYLGVREAIGPDASLGIINIDAHFDMRPYDQEPSSGTMFRQILDEDKNCQYFALGIQEFGNTKALFETAESYGCRYVLEEELVNKVSSEVLSAIDEFAAGCDYLMLTLCMDSISAAHAPGVSAPSPFGLDPRVVRTLIKYIAAQEKTISFDLSEVNPELDEGNRTVMLAANLLNEGILKLLGEEKG
ncbi:formimidoylglutamase [Bacillus aerolatus]|uniref:Formimidoylglutamase n=1 Tax=Bacillus aerolatus TaxID=2653354 RepID=A0A6I1FKN2_9BACI|nr:formimidoylglutamase [Bacillus aerolatus]KAB7706639.1 formimidoylglutamase [Bacillus aerolatus]